MQLPWGEKAGFKGVIDLISMKAYQGDGKTAVEIPAEYQEEAEEARLKLIEAAAEGEDSLLEKYFENGDLTAEEALQGLHKAVQISNIIPVMVAAGGHMIGIAPMLEALSKLAPSPAEHAEVVAKSPKGEVTLTPSDSGPLAAYVWKTADPSWKANLLPRLLWRNELGYPRLNANKGEEERLLGMVL